METVSLISTLLCWTLLGFSYVSSSDYKKEITAKPGQNVTLPCTVTNDKPVLVVEWKRTDLGDEFVLLYRDDRIDQFNQHPSFKNRVALQDKEIKKGDVSLVLKNVTTEDNGTYECRVKSEGMPNAELIRVIQLNLLLPGNQEGSTGLRVDLILGMVMMVVVLVVVLVAAVVLFPKHRKQLACFREKTPDPPAAL